MLPTGTEVKLGGGFRAMEIVGADWLELLLLPLHAARKQIAASNRDAEICRVALTANLRLKNVGVIYGIAARGYSTMRSAQSPCRKLLASSAQINSLYRSHLRWCVVGESDIS